MEQLEDIVLTSTDTLSVVTLAEKTVNTTDGESKTRLGRTAKYKRQQCDSNC